MKYGQKITKQKFLENRSSTNRNVVYLFVTAARAGQVIKIGLLVIWSWSLCWLEVFAAHHTGVFTLTEEVQLLLFLLQDEQQPPRLIPLYLRLFHGLESSRMFLNVLDLTS